MKCPVCDSETFVTRTRRVGKQVTLRRRICPETDCGYRFTTKERPETADGTALRELKTELDTLNAQLTKARRGLAALVETEREE